MAGDDEADEQTGDPVTTAEHYQLDLVGDGVLDGAGRLVEGDRAREANRITETVLDVVDTRHIGPEDPEPRDPALDEEPSGG